MAQKPRSLDLTQVSEWNDGQVVPQAGLSGGGRAAGNSHRRRTDQRHHAHARRRSGAGGGIPVHRRAGAEGASKLFRWKWPGTTARRARAMWWWRGLRRMLRLTLKRCGGIFSRRRAVAFAERHRSIRCARERCSRPIPISAARPRLLLALPDALRASQAVFGRTGGLHAAALFSASGELLALREDIGRHNAVDKVIGWALRENRVPLSNEILLVSGRGGFEIIQKAIVAGIPVVASVSAPSSLAVKLAREMGLTLVGFLRDRRFVIYAGEDRIRKTESQSRSGGDSRCERMRYPGRAYFHCTREHMYSVPSLKRGIG